MDNRHRHELQQNDLEHFLTHLGPFWEKWGMKILLTLLVIVGGYSAKTYYTQHVEAQHQAAVRDLELATSPESLRAVAQQTSEPGLSAVALLRGADLALSSAVMPEPPTPPTTQPGKTTKPPMSADDRKAALKDAEQMYKAVIEQPSASPVVRFNASIGLAAVAESRSDWDGASKLYRGVIDHAGEYGAIKARAQKRLELLEQLKSPVAFAPEPATQPASMLPGMGESFLPLRSAANAAPSATPAVEGSEKEMLTSNASVAEEKPAVEEKPAAKPVAKPAKPAASEKPAANVKPAKPTTRPAAER